MNYLTYKELLSILQQGRKKKSNNILGISYWGNYSKGKTKYLPCVTLLICQLKNTEKFALPQFLLRSGSDFS